MPYSRNWENKPRHISVGTLCKGTYIVRRGRLQSKATRRLLFHFLLSWLTPGRGRRHANPAGFMLNSKLYLKIDKLFVTNTRSTTKLKTTLKITINTKLKHVRIHCINTKANLNNALSFAVKTNRVNARFAWKFATQTNEKGTEKIRPIIVAFPAHVFHVSSTNFSRWNSRSVEYPCISEIPGERGGFF